MVDNIHKAMYDVANELDLTKHNLLYLEPTSEEVFRIDLSCFVHLLVNKVRINKMNIFMWASADEENDGDETTQGPWNTDYYQANEGPTLKCARQFAQYLNLPAENVLFYVPDYDDMRYVISLFVSRFAYQCHHKTEGGLIWFECNETYDFETLRKMLYPPTKKV